MLKEIIIRDFRGISEFTLPDLGRINILVGNNGVGKTAVLEAISILANSTSPDWLVSLSMGRQLPAPNQHQDDAIRSFFFELDVTRKPQISFVSDSKQGSVIIEADAKVDFTSPTITVFQQGADGTYQKGATTEQITGPFSQESVPEGRLPIIRRLSLSYEEYGRQPVKSVMELAGDQFRVLPTARKSGLGGFFIHARRATGPGEIARLLTYLHQTNREDYLFDLLRKIDPRVQRLWIGVPDARIGPVIMVDVGLQRGLPMTLLGDGFSRVALIATGVLWANAEVLLVDEVDSGLHYSVMESVWRGLLSLGHDRQIFCSTHSEEMLAATLEAFADDAEALRIFRIDRGANGPINATKYTYETFSLAMKAGMEIR